MKKFTVKFQRVFEVEVEAESTLAAQAVAHQILTQFLVDTVKLLSVYAEDYKAPPEDPEPAPWYPRGAPPTGGPTGATTDHVEILVDQIAEAA